MGRVLDITGEKYGKLTAVEFYTRDKHNKRVWVCLCDCGKQVNIALDSLRSGKTRSCGCLKTAMMVDRNTTHGKARTSEHSVWLSAKARTTNPNNAQAKDYLGRGIIMEEPWFSSFECFLEDMGVKPTPQHSIERIDVNGNYCKGNCIWATIEVQAYNKRKSILNTSGRTGVHWNKGKEKWEATICKDSKHIYLGSYIDFELACLIRSEAELKYHGFIKE